MPGLGTGDRERHLSFEVGLVEAREHTETVKGFELRIQVLLLIAVVSVSVETYAGSAILVDIPQLYSVPTEHNVGLFQRNSLVFEGGFNGHSLIIDRQLAYCKSIEV